MTDKSIRMLPEESTFRPSQIEAVADGQRLHIQPAEIQDATKPARKQAWVSSSRGAVALVRVEPGGAF